MRLFLFSITAPLLFSACSPFAPELTFTPIPLQQPLATSTEIPEEALLATEQAKAAAVQAAGALTRAAQPTFIPPPAITLTLSDLPTLTPIPNSTPAQAGAHFAVPADILGPRYEIESACYFDTQSGWERHEIYAGSLAGSGDEYSAQGVVVVRTLRVVEQNGEPNVELVDTQEHLTLEKRGPLQLSVWDACSEDAMLLRTPINFGWFLYPLSGEFYPYEGLAPLAHLSVGEQTQVAKLGSYCWKQGCGDAPVLPTPATALVIRAASSVHLSLPMDEPPDRLSRSVMYVSPPGVLRGEAPFDSVGNDSASWSYEKAGREPLELGVLPLLREQDIEFSLEPGYYALTILAVWQDYGDVKYGFLIEVRE